MPRSSKSQTAFDRRIDPQLRVFRNGDSEVNLMRAQQSAALGAATKSAAKGLPTLQAAQEMTVAAGLPSGKRKKLAAVSNDVLVNVFLDLNDQPGRVKGETGRLGSVATARVRLSDIEQLAAVKGVNYVSAGDAVRQPTPIAASTHAAPTRPPATAHMRSSHKDGADVLIGIIDVQGFDFAHPDFLSDGKTRWVAIWDQGGDFRPAPAESGSAPYDYGSEFTAAHLADAIAASGTVNVPAVDLEPQSQRVNGSHGTHVASICAGRTGGICRNAMIAGVLIDLPPEAEDRRRSFYDSTRVAHAVDYLFRLADKLSRDLGRPVPVSINISLGTNGHAHDASSAISRWIDSALAVPGRCICVAAGNAGQEAPTDPSDLGFIMGRIHTSGQIAAAGLNHDIFWNVVGNGLEDISENELEFWYESQDRFAVSVRPPGGDWIGPIEPGQFVENHPLDSLTMVSVFNELYHPTNGANYISVYLSPFFSDTAVKGVAAGMWTVRLHAREVRDGRFHGWIERDDPRRIGETDFWMFPSFFSVDSNVDNSSVSSLACGHRIVSVANLNEALESIEVTSSQGPTRDGRPKPDICAPGADIVAARGFGPPDEPWIEMSGTSMASPYVAGVVGLMLAIEPNLTAAQIAGIIKRTAQPLPGADFNWSDSAGFGRLNITECLSEASKATAREEVTP